ncbi:hypothetical protein MTR67_033630 [Solanum verrucosum]|uniref:Uncharacterized protein n=1 Tax=Solanum verrucosum TaxID=315347 RepID=A0AAF0U6M5_SOLVR|nr:hypothetical protein MTR67_033630 [Solanum verrucosum]
MDNALMNPMTLAELDYGGPSGETVEPVNHLFLRCMVINQLRRLFLNLKKISWSMPGRVTEALLSWKEAVGGLEIGQDILIRQGETAETVNHLFLRCMVINQLRRLFLNLKKISWTMPGRVTEVLLSCKEAGTQAKYRKR